MTRYYRREEDKEEEVGAEKERIWKWAWKQENTRRRRQANEERIGLAEVQERKKYGDGKI